MTHKEGSPLTFEELKQLDEQYVVQTYSRNPIAIDHGQGATLYDLEGKEYIDFASGIGVLSVGTAPSGRRLSAPRQPNRDTSPTSTTLSPIFSWPRSCAPAPAWRRLSLPTQGRRVTRAW